MKLYELKSGEWFRLLEDTQAPPDVGGYAKEMVMQLGNIDGMYSYCETLGGNVAHPVAWAEVERVSHEY
jgi:hypothetical protein